MASKERRENPRAWASWRLAEMYRLARVMQSHGEVLDTKKWLFYLAHTLASAPEGKLPVKPGRKGKTPTWFGLDFLSLRYAAEQSEIVASDTEIEAALQAVVAWRKKSGRQFIRIKGETIARALGVTASIRREANVKTIGAVDETSKERAQKRKQADIEKKAEKRRAEGCMSHSESLSATKPWEAEGISRRTWYRRRANGSDQGGTDSSAVSYSIQAAEEVVPTEPKRHRWFSQCRADTLYSDFNDEELQAHLVRFDNDFAKHLAQRASEDRRKGANRWLQTNSTEKPYGLDEGPDDDLWPYTPKALRPAVWKPEWWR